MSPVDAAAEILAAFVLIVMPALGSLLLVELFKANAR